VAHINIKRNITHIKHTIDNVITVTIMITIGNAYFNVIFHFYVLLLGPSFSRLHFQSILVIFAVPPGAHSAVHGVQMTIRLYII